MFAGTVLLTFLVVGAVSTQQLLGKNKCTWGPAYWCSDVSSAKECQAVSHCMTTNWKNDLRVEVEADDCCTKCEAVVDRLHNYAVLTERDTILVLNTVCDVIPGANFRQQCRDGVQTYVKEVMDMVVNKIDSKKICTLIHLCKKSQSRAHSKLPTFARVQLLRSEPKITVSSKDTETCEVCKLTVLEAKHYISDVNNQKKIVQFAKQEGCSRCPEKQKCEALIDEYAAPVFKVLTEVLDGDRVCEFIGLCGQSEHVLGPVFRQLIDVIRNIQHVGSNTACDVCKESFAKLRKYFADPKVRAAVKDLLKNQLCLLCPAKDKCQSDIEQYIDKVFNSIDSFLAKSDEICQKLGLCTKTQLPVSHIQMKQTKVWGVECTICEFVMRELDKILGKNRTEEKIIAALDKVCSLLPKTVNDECVAFVNEYGKVILNLLVQELDPSLVCTTLGLCDGKAKVNTKPNYDTALRFSPLLFRGAPMERQPAVGARISPQCVLCEFVMSKLDSLLQKNATEQDIVHALDKVCSLMPKSIGADCQKMVDEYAPAIIKILAEELRPTIVCTILGLCPFKHVSPKSNEFCEACEMAMIYLESLMKENATQEEIEHLLLKICNFLPEVIRGECNMFVMLYTPEIVQMLINEIAPKQVCTELRLCSGKAKDMSNHIPMVQLAKALLKPKTLFGGDTNKCMYGPSYWCASRYNAKKCRMTAHCQEHFWNKNKLN